MRYFLSRLVFFAAVSAALSLPAAAADLGAIAGTVRSAAGDPVAGATAKLAGTTRSTLTKADGTFRFERVPPTVYHVEVESDRFGLGSATVTVAAGQTASVEMELDLVIHGEQVVVTANADVRTLADLAQPVGVLTGDDLTRAARPSLGETLATQPGVSSTSFGAGASRPVVRGQGGNRIRILENGVDSGDVSDTSPDHAVALEPLGAEKIEIVRGPATLLYGSNAIGGVVNVIDDRIPEYLAKRPVEGTLSLVGATNADERTGAASVGGSLARLAWHATGFSRKTADYASGEGTVVNSDVAADGGGLGLSLVGEDGFIGASVRRYDSNYGNPAEEEVRLDLRQRRLDLRGGITKPLGIFTGLRLRYGRTDYEHTEFEGPEVGTRFLNDSWEARVDATHRQLAAFNGSVGVQFSNRAFAAIGEEAFVPPTDNDVWAAFLFEEIGTGRLRGQFGVRHESERSSADGEPDRSFSATSGSAGVLWRPSDAFAAALTVSRAVKLPDPEELYANGPHAATQVFEIGDPDLDQETTRGVDLSLRRTAGRVRAELSLFSNRVDGFIFPAFTGEVVEGEEEPLPVVRFEQLDAEFVGGEAQAHIELIHDDPHHLELELSGDVVRAKLSDTGEPLPRITPARLAAGLRYQGTRFSGSLFVRRIAKQDRVAAFETETDGFTTIEASVGYRFFTSEAVHDLILSAANLTDELARNHVSFLKDVAPLPGRDLRLTYRLTF